MTWAAARPARADIPFCWKDFLDERNTKAAKDAIGEALLPVLCDVCFSLTAPKTSVDFRCTVSTGTIEDELRS